MMPEEQRFYERLETVMPREGAALERLDRVEREMLLRKGTSVHGTIKR